MDSDFNSIIPLSRELNEKCALLMNRWLPGETACNFLKCKKSKNWRQDEWAGFFLEEFIRNSCFNGMKGPYYADCFDEERCLPIEVKMHSSTAKNDEILLNSVWNTKKLLEEYHRILLIVGFHDSKIDNNGKFREWHNEFKGGKITNYVGNYHRSLKNAVKLTSIKCSLLTEESLDKLSLMSRDLNDKYKVKIEDLNFIQ